MPAAHRNPSSRATAERSASKRYPGLRGVPVRERKTQSPIPSLSTRDISIASIGSLRLGVCEIQLHPFPVISHPSAV